MIKNKKVLHLPVSSRCLVFSTFQGEIKISIWQGTTEFLWLFSGNVNTVLKTDKSFVYKKLKATLFTLHR